MLSEQQCISKLHDMAFWFRTYVRQKKYDRAKRLYNNAVSIALFLDLPAEEKRILFGGYAGDYEEDEEVPDGLFSKEAVQKVDYECCVRRNMAYEDMACRKSGKPVRYYSEDDYCAGCAKAGAGTWKRA